MIVFYHAKMCISYSIAIIIYAKNVMTSSNLLPSFMYFAVLIGKKDMIILLPFHKFYGVALRSVELLPSTIKP